MECLTAIVGTLVTEVAKSAFKQVEHHISYVFQHKRRVRDFQKSLQTLKERRDGVQRDADAADRNAEEIYANVTEWLKTVDDVTLDAMAKEVKDLEDKAEKKCFIGLCPNFKSRYQLSKRAEKDAKSAYELLQKGDFENISYRDVPPPIEFKCSENFDSFGSRKRVFNNILKALKDPSINFIVVYGMPGVGKTTLVTEIARQVSKEDKSFSSVVIAAVTQNPDIQIIQDQIAGRLGLKFEEQSLRASLLYKRLKKEKKILIVLDDIWAKLDLMSVGIPFGDEHMGCIVLITTRNLNALDGWKALNGREADMRSKFEIDVLSQEEAWDLFKKTAGNKVESHDLKSIANKIAKKCASLPIAITAVAKALRNKELSEWRNALHLLNKPCSINFGEDEATAGAYKAIELSYSYLKSKELQQTFLLCSLLGHNALIQDLLKYAIGLGLFQGLRTVQGTRDRLLTMLSRLKASCLLLDSYNNLCFDMHDLVSDVAISIISKDDRVFAVRHDEVLNEDDWPDGEKMKRCEKINLLSARINKLPCQLECPELTCFLVQRKDPSLKIPSEFFEKMRNLKVLDLTKFDFPSLPSSICLLANLRTLCLDQCVLGDISIIGELKNLEILSLLASDIEMLPKEIGQLIKLKLLDLSRCTRLKTIPPNILSCLSRLEELYMGNSFVQWEAEGHPSEQSNASLDELKALSSLTTLYVHIPNARMIPKDLSFEKLERYKVFIGEAWDWLDEIEYERTLKLKLHTNIGHLSRGMKLLLVKADNLYLDEMKDLEILLYMSEGRECFQRLKSLYVQKGALIQYIIGDNDVDKIEFLQLKSLTLHGLPKLISFCSQNRGSTSISTQELPLFNEKIVFPTLENLKLSSISIKRIWEKGSHSMQNLTSFILEGCSNLKHVLSYSMVECLQQLKCLEIIDCNSIQEIISREEIMKEGHGKTVSFPLLKSLKLKGLEKLIGFCHEDYIVEFQSLNILEIQHCPELKGFTINRSMGKDITTSSTSVVLFNEKAAFPNLEKITIAHLRNVSRIWYNQPYGDSFSRLKELEVEYCDNLLNIFSSYLMGVFQRLEMLRVTDCDSLEEVFNIEETCVEPIQLRELFLFHLPKMKHVWNKDPHGNISFQNLRVVKVRHCQSLKSLFPFSIAQGLLLLESLVVYWCRVEEIVSESVEGLPQEIRFQFNQLSFLMLWGLEDLKWFYPRQHSTVWPALTTLKTYKCEKIKIFGQGESQVQQPLFLIEKVIPRLQTVYFSKDDIATICDGQYATYFFGGIKVLGIIGFQFALLPSYFLQRFYELEILELVECSFEELPLCVGDVGEKKDMMETDQPKIKKLKLNGCFKMTRLWNQDSQLDHICASLETLQVWHCRDLINLAPASSSFRNLTTLDVWDCNEMAKLITSSKAQSLVCLVTMKLSECEMMTEIVSSEGDEATHEIIFRELKCLELHCLQSLKGFCSGNNIFTFPSLEDVTVSQCPRLKSFCKGDLSTPKLQKVFYQKKADYKGCWAGDLNATIQQLHEELHGEKIGYHGLKKLKFLESSELMDIWNRNPQEILDFKNLEFLEICNSNELRCILDLSLASNLGRLQQIEIKRSNKMEQVIKEADKAIADNEIINILPLLKFIVIESCPHLTSFYLGSTTLVFPSLESIEVVDCPNMTTFVSTLTREEHKEAKIADGPQRNKDDPDTPVAFFCDKIGDGTQRNKDDPDTRTAFFCDKVVFRMLKKLCLRDLGKLKKIWHDQLAAVSFCKLEYLQVSGCHKLLHVFPFNMSEKLHRLKELDISLCNSLEEVIEPQRMNVFPTPQSDVVEVEKTTKFVFPEVTYLEFYWLPNLKSFYHKVHTTEWPSLKKIFVYGCDKVEVLTSKYQNFQNTIGQRRLEIQVQQPLFWVDKVTFPSLEELKLEDNDIMKEIWQGRCHGEFFGNLKILELIRFPRQAAALSYGFIQALPNLEKLVVSDASFSHIFKCQGLGGAENHAGALAYLSEFRLSKLPELTDIWDEEFQQGQAFYNLNILEVEECGKLKILVPSSVSFQNLTSLVISRCNGLISLFTHSTVKCLVQLTTMRINDCEMIEEIIACTIDEVKDSIIFTQLKHLGLCCLPNLANFCSGNYAIHFPSLEEVVVDRCPKMMIFSRGELSTPKLQGVKFTEDDKGPWEGNLNTTIEQYFNGGLFGFLDPAF